METKSRYEIMAELEAKKRQLILERNSLENFVYNQKKEIKQLKRQLEDKEEDLIQYESTMKEQEDTYDELIKSVTESLDKIQSQTK